MLLLLVPFAKHLFVQILWFALLSKIKLGPLGESTVKGPNHGCCRILPYFYMVILISEHIQFEINPICLLGTFIIFLYIISATINTRLSLALLISYPKNRCSGSLLVNWQKTGNLKHLDIFSQLLWWALMCF